MAANDPIEVLNSLLKSQLFSRQNAEKVARVCYDASRIVYERQKRTGKTTLKTKEVSDALLLAESLHASAFRFIAEGPLIQLFKQCGEETAIDYFEKSVMGDVTDQYGRIVVIDEDGMKSLYKDPKQAGAHVIASANYEEVRGKRLPWIRHTIANSDAVYVEEEVMGRSGIRRKFFYTAIVTMHGKGEEYTSYYVVVVREEAKNQTLRMVTAFSMFERDGFLHTISASQRYVKQNRRLTDRNPDPIQAHQIPIATG